MENRESQPINKQETFEDYVRATRDEMVQMYQKTNVMELVHKERIQLRVFIENIGICMEQLVARDEKAKQALIALDKERAYWYEVKDKEIEILKNAKKEVTDLLMRKISDANNMVLARDKEIESLKCTISKYEHEML